MTAVALTALGGVGVGLIDRAKLQAAFAQAVEARAAAEAGVYGRNVVLADREWAAGNAGRVDALLAECPDDLRGWEWHYLSGLRHRGRATLWHDPPARGGAWSVRGVAYRPDGARLASATRGGIITVWNPTGPRAEVRVDLAASGCGLAYSPDGRRLAVAQDGGTVVLLDAGTGGVVNRFTVGRGSCYAAAFSPDGLLLAAGTAAANWENVGRSRPREVEHGVRVWECDTGREVAALAGDDLDVLDVAFSPDGRQVAAATGLPRPSPLSGRPGRVVVWDWAEGRTAAVLSGHAGPVTAVAFAPDGRSIASAGLDRTVRVWNPRAGTATVLRGHRDGVHHLAYRADGTVLATAGADGLVGVWDAASGRVVRFFRGHTGPVYRVAYRPDGKELASAGGDRTVRLWDPDRDQEADTAGRLGGPVSGLAVTPDGRIAYGGPRVGAAEDVGSELVVTGRAGFDAADPDWPLSGLAAGGDVIAAAVGKRVKTWDAGAGRPGWASDELSAKTVGVALAPAGRRVAALCRDGQVSVWDAVGGPLAASFRVDAPLFGGLSFDPAGDRLAVTGGRGAVSLYDSRTGAVRSFPAHDRLVSDVAFSPDGTLVASASWDQTAKVWDAAAARDAAASARAAAPVAVAAGHMRAVTSVAFSPDGQRLVTGSEDRTVRVWDPRTGRELLTLTGHDDAVTRVAFTPDGRRLVSADQSGVVKVWGAATDAGR